MDDAQHPPAAGSSGNQDRPPGPGAPAGAAEVVRSLSLLERGTRAALVLTVVAFGVWTLLYQAALLGDLGVTVTVLAAVVLSVLCGYAVLPSFSVRLTEEAGPSTPRWQYAVAAAVAVLAVVAGLRGARVVAVALLTLAAAVGVLDAVRSGRMRQGVLGRPAGGEPGLWLVGWFWALGCGVLSAVMTRPDGDDAYFLNLTEWVADRGDFPVLDTMLSDEGLPALVGHDPPVHSFEGMIGAVGWLTGQSGGVLTYLVAAPVLTVASVLAMTWLVSVARVPYAPVALSSGVLYLLLSGGGGASFGNFFALRMWQGKSVLASFVLPVVVAVGIEYLRHGGWRRALVLFLAAVAAVGASNTAVFLLPVLLAGLLLAALVTRQPRRTVGVALALAYPVACGVAVLLLAPVAPEAPLPAGEAASRPLNPLTAVPGWRGLMATTFIAVAVGWVGLRSWVARVVIVCITLALGVALLPPVTQALSSAAGVGAVIWRVWWVLPVPLLVAGVTGTVANLVRGRWRPTVVISTAVVVGVLPLWGGRWIGSSGNHARWSSPVAWKTPLGSESGARLALRLSESGDVVLAPDYPSRVLAGMSVDVHPVVARRLYLRQYLPVEGALAEERGQLQDFANERLLPAGTLRPLLEQLSVDTVCLARNRAEARVVLEEVGYRQVVEGGDLVCARREAGERSVRR